MSMRSGLLGALAGVVLAEMPLMASPPKIGIAWRDETTSTSLENVKHCIVAAGGIPVYLPQVKSTAVAYAVGDRVAAGDVDANGFLSLSAAARVKAGGFAASNAAEVLGDLRGIVFTGGADLSPTLYKTPAPWLSCEHNYNPTRDVSDYLLMQACLARTNLAVLAICRGEQLLGVVSGAALVQDIPTYLRSKGVARVSPHRLPKGSTAKRATHPVDLFPGTLASRVFDGCAHLEGMPSSHHQMIADVTGTPLRVAGHYVFEDVDCIEVVERTDRPFVLGVQFHPESTFERRGTGDVFTVKEARCPFTALVKAVQEQDSAKSNVRK